MKELNGPFQKLVRACIVAASFILFATNASADPLLTSWLTNYSAQYARVYVTTAKRSSGNSATTWTNQSAPSYADISQIMYSANSVYVRYPDLGSYVMGPWETPQGGVFQFWPVNQHGLAKFPRNAAVQNGKKTITGTGYSGNYVNGVAIFNALDGKAWDGGALVSGPHNRATYCWHRNAPVGESFNFDYALGHQNPTGVYHTHQDPIALRYQLGDHVTYDTSTKNYSVSTNAVTNHSPIVGWSYDGYPIYGPYGYSISNNASSGVRRMISGYVERDGSNGTDNVLTNLSVIPAWYARFRQSQFNLSYSTTVGTNRPSDTATYPVGTFAEDWSYMADLTNSATGKAYVQGTDFDLDVYNGRFCVTPEYPSGTYAYFIDIDSSGSATYPYVFGFEFYGVASGTNSATIAETVTTNFVGGADTPLTINSASVNATNFNVTLVWSSVEGGTYQVENSANQSTWLTNVASMSSQGTSTSTNYTNVTTSGTSYGRVTRTALATYDDADGSSAVVGQTNTISYLIRNDAPTVANPISNRTNTYGTSLSYTFPANTFNDIDTGQTLSYAASSSLLTNTGISFNAAARTFSATIIDATNGGTIAGTYPVQLVATDNGSPAMSATNTFTWVISKATASVTSTSTARFYGATNPTFSGTLSGFVAADSIAANYSCTATASSASGTYGITATLNDPGNRLGNYTVSTNLGVLTINKAPLTVTADSPSRAFGQPNPILTGTLSGVVNNDGITASFSTTATSTSPAGMYPIIVTLNDPASALSSYSVTTNQGTLTITNASASSNYFVSLTLSNSLVLQGMVGTTNYTFVDTNSGLAIVVAVTMNAYSASNGTPAITFLDTFGPDGRPARLGVDSHYGSGDGNWLDYFEGVDFSASLVSVSSGIDTNSIQFGIAGIGLRPNGGLVTTWTSSACTTALHYNGEVLYAADTNSFAMSDATYFAEARLDSSSQVQLSDAVDSDFNGLVLQASFFVGTQTVRGSAATLGQPTVANGQVHFTISGTSGANYIVQSIADLGSTNWTPVVTNAAPFTFTDTNLLTQKFYRAIAQ